MWMALCVAASISLIQATSTEEIRFAGVPWRANAQTIKAAMLEHGFKFAEMDKEGDLVFTGTIEGEVARILALRTKDDKLVKWVVRVAPPDHRTVAYYQALRREMMERYGRPAVDLEQWKFPYENGGHRGHEETAIRNGKGTLKAAWSTVGELPAIIAEITDRLVVQVAYEGPGWNEEADKRKKRVW